MVIKLLWLALEEQVVFCVTHQRRAAYGLGDTIPQMAIEHLDRSLEDRVEGWRMLFFNDAT